MDGAIVITSLFAGVTVLHVIFSGPIVSGYCADAHTLRPYSYKLNGFFVSTISAIIFLNLPLELQALLYDNVGTAAFAANELGLLSAAILFIVGRDENGTRCLTVDQVQETTTEGRAASSNGHRISTGYADEYRNSSLFQKFFLGRNWNVHYRHYDLKMFLYIIGAVGLQCIILSGIAVQRLRSPDKSISSATVLYVGMFGWFLLEYMYFEKVHLYTYDLFAERMGFKLVWGCLVFYPFFYSIGLYSLVDAHVHATANDLNAESGLSTLSMVLIAAVFLCGWIITRGANLQKYAFRTNPTKPTFMFLFEVFHVRQIVLDDTRILISGWWGLARHFNYFGEILQGFALALPGLLVGRNLFYKLLPLLYPVYYIVLFITRQIDDDKVCKAKYGEKWDEYCRKVKWRICPGLW